MPNLVLVLGDTLFENKTWPPGTEVYMHEDEFLCTRVRHHQQKLVLVLSAMRHYRDALRSQGWKVHYKELQSDRRDSKDIFQGLTDQITVSGAKVVYAFEPHDRFFKKPLAEAVESAGARLEISPSQGFLTSNSDWSAYRSTTKRRLMADFYVWQRRRLRVLVDEQQNALGGRWSFDSENRLKLPKHVYVPPTHRIEPDELTREVIGVVEHHFSSHPGKARDFGYPVTRDDAVRWFEKFLRERLELFGPYEDALTERSETVFHSVLTPMLNLGLLTPREVLDRTLQFADEAGIQLASLEGFIRQIIGWREFVRCMDLEAESPKNYFSLRRTLNSCWYDATTGIPPVDYAIRKALSSGYCHHIERLMVLGNAMLLCEIAPQAAYDWFMEMFIDSTDWVMGPNVFGMSQFAEGPQGFATKPYISGSAYILKMSDFERGPWCEIWDGLYWRFLQNHQDKLSQNPRMQTALLGLKRLQPDRKDRIFSLAENFIHSVSQ